MAWWNVSISHWNLEPLSIEHIVSKILREGAYSFNDNFINILFITSKCISMYMSSVTSVKSPVWFKHVSPTDLTNYLKWVTFTSRSEQDSTPWRFYLNQGVDRHLPLLVRYPLGFWGDDVHQFLEEHLQLQLEMGPHWLEEKEADTKGRGEYRQPVRWNHLETERHHVS